MDTLLPVLTLCVSLLFSQTREGSGGRGGGEEERGEISKQKVQQLRDTGKRVVVKMV
jgi:hypothetical protein